MDIPTVLGAPRLCFLARKAYLVRPMTVRDRAIIINWLDDVIPGRSERKMPIKVGDEAAQDALGSLPGRVLLIWLAMDEHGFSYADAENVVPQDDDGDSEAAQRKALEYVRVFDIYMSRRRTLQSGEDGEDVSETWYAKSMASFAMEYGLEAIGDLTLDQYDFLCSDGMADEFGQFDLKAIQDTWERDDLPRIKAAMEAGQAEAILPMESPNA